MSGTCVKGLARPHYSEQEAADQLGLSLEEFRSLLRSHIVENEKDLDHASITNFHPSDILVLKLLSGMK